MKRGRGRPPLGEGDDGFQVGNVAPIDVIALANLVTGFTLSGGGNVSTTTKTSFRLSLLSLGLNCLKEFALFRSSFKNGNSIGYER